MRTKSLVLLVSVLVSAASLQAQTTTSVTNLPSVTIVAPDPTALAGTSSGAFTLLLGGVLTNHLTVSLGISGTASNGVDYATITNAVTIPAGFLAVDIAVDPIVDTASRGNKTVVLTVQTNADYRVGSAKRASVLIIDDIYNIVPPTVTLTSPTNGSVYSYPAAIVLTAEAGDLDVAIKSVSFYAGDRFLGSVTNSPYSLDWTNASPGRYTLFARAVDQVGQSTLSAPITISVTNEVPVISLTSPTNGQNFTARADIPLTAEFSADTLTVQFYANSRLLATITNASSPASFTWTNVSAGVYSLRGTAINAGGTRGYSSSVTINVSRH